MAIKLELELSDDDLAYCRKAMEATWRRNEKRDEKEIVKGARRLLQQMRASNAPEYVRNRLDDLGTLLDMLEDSEWPLDEEDRRRLLVGASYFAEPIDMIPDRIPGLGFLDDALLAELVIRELKHELDGYREFCEYRRNEATLRGKTDVSREDWLAAKRRQIHLRVKQLQEGTRRHASTEGPTDPILQYRY